MTGKIDVSGFDTFRTLANMNDESFQQVTGGSDSASITKTNCPGESLGVQ